jgi:hypothetical protein
LDWRSFSEPKHVAKFVVMFIYIYIYFVFWLNKLLYHDISRGISVPSSRNYFSTWLEILHIPLSSSPWPGHNISCFAFIDQSTFCNQAQFSAGTVMDMIIDTESRCWPLKTGFTQSLTKSFKTANNDTFYLLLTPLTTTVPPCAAHFRVIYSWKYTWLKSDAFHTFVMGVAL